MKSLWKLLGLAGVLSAVLTIGVAAGCGPQQAFCPNTGNGGVCPIEGDDAQAMPGVDAQGLACDAGSSPGIDPVTHVFTCIPN
jgi:hypothetical protein